MKHRWTHFIKFEDNLDDAEFETDAKPRKAGKSMENNVKNNRECCGQIVASMLRSARSVMMMR